MIRKWVLRGLAGLGGLLVLGLVYLWTIPEPSDQLPSTLVPAGREAALMETVSGLLGAPILEANHVELLLNGDRIFPPMLEAIRSSRQSIHFLTYVFWTGDIARRFADVLSDAARRGVKVRILLDAFGAQRMREELVTQMEEAGCEVAWYHPLRWYRIRQWNHRTHRKILVVDGEVGFTGGVGIAEEWTGDAQDRNHWRDDHFRVRGPVVGALLGAFADNWVAATGEVLTTGDSAPGASRRSAGPPGARAPDLEGGARILPIFTSPRVDLSPIAFTYWLALRAARSTVDIATPYFVPDPALTREIAAAAERGVRVRLLVPGDVNDSWLARYASLVRYGRLLRAGVEIHEFRPTMLHTKAILIDGRFSLIGSPNFDNRSIELNDEIALLVDSPRLHGAILESFEGDLGRASRVSLEAHRSRGPWTRLRSWFANAFHEQL